MADAAGSAPIVVFDLDGTLVDTAPDLVDTLNIILARERLAPVPFKTARTMIGGGARTLIERGLQAAGRASGTTEVSRLYDDFVAHYSEHLADRSQPFPGVIAAIEELAERGCRFAICTSSPAPPTTRKVSPTSCAVQRKFSAVHSPNTASIEANAPIPQKAIANRRHSNGFERTYTSAPE